MSTPTIQGILQVQITEGHNVWTDEYPIQKSGLALGRSGDGDIILEDSLVSRRHALLIATPEGFQIQDQGSANGSLMNGQPLPPRRPWPMTSSSA